MDKKKEYLTPEEVSDILKIDVQTLQRYVRQGKIPEGKKITRNCVRWEYNVIYEYLNNL